MRESIQDTLRQLFANDKSCKASNAQQGRCAAADNPFPGQGRLAIPLAPGHCCKHRPCLRPWPHDAQHTHYISDSSQQQGQSAYDCATRFNLPWHGHMPEYAVIRRLNQCSHCSDVIPRKNVRWGFHAIVAGATVLQSLYAAAQEYKIWNGNLKPSASVHREIFIGKHIISAGDSKRLSGTKPLQNECMIPGASC